MKIFKTISILALIILASAGNVKSQEYTLEGVGRNELRNSGTIMDGNIIKGYFYFYYSEKVSKKNANYQIVILDEDLNEKASEVITESNRTYLLEASYNGTAILFKFFNDKEDKVYYRTMDNEGKLSSKEERDVNKYELAGYVASSTNGLKNVNVHNVTDKYFVDVFTYKDKDFTYSAECVDNEGRSVWTYTAPVAKGVKTGGYLASSNNQILILEATSKSRMSKDYTFNIVSLDMNGELTFELGLESSKHTLLPHNAFINDKEEITLIGEYYDAKDKSMKSESKGIFVKVIDQDGSEISENYISWNKDIAGKVSASQKSEVSRYSLFFHDMQMTKSGKIIAIGEQYRKQISAAGNAMKVMAAAAGSAGSTDASSFEIKIGNMFIITLNPDGELDDVSILEKKPNRVTLSQSYGLVNQHLLAKILKAEGAFDYRFTQTNEDNSLITVGYVDVEKQKGKLFRTVVLNLVNFSDGEDEPVYDKVSLETDATDMIVSPAKPGYVLIAEYFRKNKTIVIRLEPVNY